LPDINCNAREPAGLQLEPIAGSSGIVRGGAVAHARLPIGTISPVADWIAVE